MKFLWVLYTVCCLIIPFFAISYVHSHKSIAKSDSKFSFSPLPSFLSLTANAQVTTLDLWTPQQNSENTPGALEDITAKNALSYDITVNQFLFKKNINQKVAMASLTKIMTAIISLEHQKTDDAYLVPTRALVGEDSMGLGVGETLSQKDLLYGIFLNSGNDAAETLAANYPGGRQAYITAMNAKAESLGLMNTHFSNPTGLEGDGDQHTTAYDLLVITRDALINFPVIDEVGGTVEEILPQTATHKEYDLENETNLLTTYPGVQGLKTGYTPEAGWCLITYLNYNGHKIIAIVLGSQSRREDMKKILDYSLEKLHITPPLHD